MSTAVNPLEYEFGIGDRLRKVLSVQGVSVERAAELFEVNRNTVGNWISGRTTPDRRTLLAFSAAFNVPVSWIERGEWPADAFSDWLDDARESAFGATQKGPDSAGESGAGAVPCTPWDSNPEPTDSEFWAIVERLEIEA